MLMTMKITSKTRWCKICKVSSNTNSKLIILRSLRK